MMSSFGLWLRRLMGRCLSYALGVFVVVAVLGAGAFIFAKPTLLAIVNAEMRKYGVEAETSDISLMGKINVRNMRIALKDGGVMTVEQMSGRPPLSWLGGTASLYNVLVKYGHISILMPELHVSGVTQGARNAAITSRAMQMLMRVHAARVQAPAVYVTYSKGESHEKVAIQHLVLHGLQAGKIRSLSFDGLDSDLTMAPPGRATAVSELGSGPLFAENVDIAAAYSLVKGAPAAMINTAIVGPVSVSDVKLAFTGPEKSQTRVGIGTLSSDGLSLSPGNAALPEAAPALFASRHSLDAGHAHETGVLQGLRPLLESMAALDAKISDVTIDNPQLKMAFSYFEITSRQWDQLLPQGFVISLHDLNLDMTALHNDYARFLQDIGYARLHLSLMADVLWDPAARTMSLRNIAFAGRDVGELSFQTTLLNFDKGFFSGDPARMLAAVEQAAIAEFDMRLADHGLIDHFVDWETRQINISRQELRDSLYETLGAFMRNASALHIRVAARQSRGISLADFIKAQDDMSFLLDRVDLSVSEGGQQARTAGF